MISFGCNVRFFKFTEIIFKEGYSIKGELAKTPEACLPNKGGKNVAFHPSKLWLR